MQWWKSRGSATAHVGLCLIHKSFFWHRGVDTVNLPRHHDVYRCSKCLNELSRPGTFERLLRKRDVPFRYDPEAAAKAVLRVPEPLRSKLIARGELLSGAAPHSSWSLDFLESCVSRYIPRGNHAPHLGQWYLPCGFQWTDANVNPPTRHFCFLRPFHDGAHESTSRLHERGEILYRDSDSEYEREVSS